MTYITNMSDEDLIEKANNYVSKLSFYEAAEGNWEIERVPRERCRSEAAPIRAEMQRRGLKATRAGLVGMD